MSGDFNPDHSSTMKVDMGILMDAVSSGKMKTARQSIAGTIDYVWLYKALFEVFIDEYVNDDDMKASVCVIIGEYLAKDSTIADRQINFDCCILAIMMEMETKIKFEK